MPHVLLLGGGKDVMYVAASAMTSDESRSEVVVVDATSAGVPLSKYR